MTDIKREVEREIRFRRLNWANERFYNIVKILSMSEIEEFFELLQRTYFKAVKEEMEIKMKCKICEFKSRSWKKGEFEEWKKRRGFKNDKRTRT